LATEDNSRDRVATLLAGDERPRYHLQPTVDANEEIGPRPNLKVSFRKYPIAISRSWTTVLQALKFFWGTDGKPPPKIFSALGHS
jgi:hypothetical protein